MNQSDAAIRRANGTSGDFVNKKFNSRLVAPIMLHWHCIHVVVALPWPGMGRSQNDVPIMRWCSA
jgi:hypothetical protein